LREGPQHDIVGFLAILAISVSAYELTFTNAEDDPAVSPERPKLLLVPNSVLKSSVVSLK